MKWSVHPPTSLKTLLFARFAIEEVFRFPVAEVTVDLLSAVGYAPPYIAEHVICVFSEVCKIVDVKPNPIPSSFVPFCMDGFAVNVHKRIFADIKPTSQIVRICRIAPR